MHHATQVALTRRVIDFVERGTTELASSIFLNPVSTYTCLQQAAREAELFFRNAPLFFGLSCELPNPGDFRADSYLEDRPWDYGGGRATDVVLHVDAGHEVAVLQAAGPDARAEHLPDGSARVTIRAVDVRAVVNFALGFLDRVEIVEPPEARTLIVELLEARVGS